MGDININLLSTHNTHVTNYLQVLANNGIKPNINVPTRIQTNVNGRTSKSCIDHINTRIKNGKIKTFVSDDDISDHYSVIGIYEQNPTINKINSDEIKTRKITITDKNKFDEALLTNLSEINYQADHFSFTLNALQNAYNSSRTEKYITNKKCNIKSPWITKKVKKIITKRKNTKKKLRKNPRNKTLIERHRELSNKIRRLANKARNDWYYKKTEQVKEDPKKTWKEINQILGKNKRKDNTIMKNFKIDSENTDEIKLLANEFANGVTSKIIDMQHDCNIKCYDFKPDTSLRSFTLEYASVFEVKKIIKKMKSKGPGYDKVMMADIKRNENILAPHITQFINEIIDKKVIPEEMKLTVITPVFKNKGRKNDVVNYRPIAAITAFTKIFEQYLYDSLMRYLKKYKLIHGSIWISTIKINLTITNGHYRRYLLSFKQQ